MQARLEEYRKVKEGKFARTQAEADEVTRHVERADDPMAEYMRAKRGVTGSGSGGGGGGGGGSGGGSGKPQYSGPKGKPNRYNIKPGYRWDGIDRGNGFEDKVLGMRGNKGLTDEKSYKCERASEASEP